MPKTSHDEIQWNDLGYAGFIALVSPGILLDKLHEAIKSFSCREAKPSPHAFVSYPAKVVAEAFDAAGNTISRSDRMILSGLVVAAFPAIKAGCVAAAYLGYSWAGLTGGHALAATLAAAGGLGAGIVALPVAATALLGATGLCLGVKNLFMRVPRLGQAFREGCRQTRRVAAVKETPAPPEVATQPAPSLLMNGFDAAAGLILEQPAEERVRYLSTLRRKFPADFADAVRSGLHAPVLRKDITVRRPVRLRAGAKIRAKGGQPWRP
jgi:hypothetical protein